MRKSLRSALAGLFLALGTLLCPHLAAAQVDPWEFEVYPYATEQRGVAELEVDNAVIANGHSQGGNGTAAGTFRSQGIWYNQYELTYGLTDRIEAAAYLNMAQVPGHGYWYAGSKYRLRGRFFDEGTLPVDLGWYLELEWHKTPQFDDDQLELELRPIIEKDVGGFSIMLDPSLKSPYSPGRARTRASNSVTRAASTTDGCATARRGSSFTARLAISTITIRSSTQQHYIFPVIWGELPHGIEYNVGPGFGLTRGSDHVIMKFNVELEHFVGAIFGQSSDSGWFF